MEMAIALALKPLALVLLFVLVLYPVRMAVIKWWPAGKVKDFLLRRE